MTNNKNNNKNKNKNSAGTIILVTICIIIIVCMLIGLFVMIWYSAPPIIFWTTLVLTIIIFSIKTNINI